MRTLESHYYENTSPPEPPPFSDSGTSVAVAQDRDVTINVSPLRLRILAESLCRD